MTKEHEMTWTIEKIKTLKKLWQKGKSTVEIGRELGISKNAVVGKVHRLELNSRPSPIKKDVAPKVIKPKVQKTDKMSLLDLKLTSCRWPMGEPKDPDFHFCGKDTITGKPYCSEHCKVAYTSLKELASQKAEAKKNMFDDEEDDKSAMKPTKKEDVKATKKTGKKMTKETPKNEKKAAVTKTPAKKEAPAPKAKKIEPQKPATKSSKAAKQAQPTKAVKPVPKAKAKKK